jgi:ADP-ribosyl-[dinitrogen reductase] hydrolase
MKPQADHIMKTSVSHPLQIATIAPGVSGSGRVGVTGAAAIVTLLEPKELTLLRVERLGEEVIRRNML